MLPTRPQQSRYVTTARRAVLARQVALTALVVAPGLAACGGNDDAAVFASASTQPQAATTTVEPDVFVPSTETASTAAPATAAPETTVATVPPTTVAETVAPVATEAPPASIDATFPAGAELAVSFTFSPSASGGRIQNPYVAVWVEDADGNLAKTISLWFEQSNKGQRWLKDLRQWASVSGSSFDGTTSGATRTAGDYTVVWDGTDADGAPVAQGDYVLYIEAAREHGPYEITSTPIEIGGDGFTVALADNGELTNASAELLV